MLWTVAGGMTCLVANHSLVLFLLTEPNECSNLNWKMGHQWKANHSWSLETCQSRVPLRLAACSPEEMAGGSQAALEHSWFLSCSSFLLQNWWRECKNFYCCSSDSTESNSKKTIFSLDSCFSLPSFTFLLLKASLKQSMEGTRSSPVCHQS